MRHLEATEELSSVIKEGIWLVDFSATWCGPCQMLNPVLEKASEKHSIIGIDVDQHAQLAEEFGIFSVPTLLITKNGKEMKRVVGYHSLSEIEELFSVE